MKVRILLLSVILLANVSALAQTYVAIGDSLAFGFQQDKFYSLLFSGQYDPSKFNTGFVDVIDGVLRPYLPNMKTVNFSCPGETTVTLVNGGCPMHNWLFALPLHQDYSGVTPQIWAAIQYLQAHPNETLFMTVTIGANDILGLISDCSSDMTCVQQGLPATTAQATQILGNVIQVLRVVSPGTVILYTNVPDPFMFSNPETLPAFDSFNSAMGTTAKNQGARVVDWFAAMKQYDEPTFCALSFFCTPPSYDIHPTDAGYQVLALYTIQKLVE